MTATSAVTYAIAVTVDRPFGDPLTTTREALAAPEFGVLTEIGMRATPKAKPGADFAPHDALQT